MDVILAMDLMQGKVVHGRKGERATYRPLTWGLSPTTDPIEYVRFLRPRFLYVADLDRIQGRGSHDDAIRSCSALVEHTYLDRGCRSPSDCPHYPGITDVVGTETAGDDLSIYQGGYLSLDLQDGKVLPRGTDPVSLLAGFGSLDFEGVILLNIAAVGTSTMPAEVELRSWREACDCPLLYGGGIAGADDLGLLQELGYQGAILSTALHRGRIPLALVQEGCLC
ncbi:MAG: nickel transporter [Methanomicrobiales archaeon]|nr:nickel transporter [Methanomicrobiales archaeon]